MTSSSSNILFKDNKISVITFSTKDASFAIPLDQVLYIEKDVKRNIKLDELETFNHEVITYQNATVELYDFNKLIGSEDYRSRMKVLRGQLDDFRDEYDSWTENIESAIQAETLAPSAPTKVVEFIKWTQQFQNTNTDLKEVIQSLAEPAKDLVKQLDKIAHASANKDYAMPIFRRTIDGSYKAVMHQIEQAQERAETSVRPIILFVEHNNGRISALRLDNINDIVSYDWKNFSQDDSSDGLMKHRQDDYSIEGFLRNDDEAPLMLINCKVGLTQEIQAEAVA
jgi:chemotaxis signal transduction protein